MHVRTNLQRFQQSAICSHEMERRHVKHTAITLVRWRASFWTSFWIVNSTYELAPSMLRQVSSNTVTSDFCTMWPYSSWKNFFLTASHEALPPCPGGDTCGCPVSPEPCCDAVASPVVLFSASDVPCCKHTDNETCHQRKLPTCCVVAKKLASFKTKTTINKRRTETVQHWDKLVVNSEQTATTVPWLLVSPSHASPECSCEPLRGARSSSDTTARTHTLPHCSTAPEPLSPLSSLASSEDSSLREVASALGMAPAGIHLASPAQQNTF